jgi:hypothetical protein
MRELFRRIVSSRWTPWFVAGMVLIVLILSGALNLRFGGLFGGDYVSDGARLAGADRSQPLRMRLEGQYAGPLQDTTIQRWRDPVDGTICYIYLPIAVAHAPGPSGFVQYGAANIGSISCLPKQ